VGASGRSDAALRAQATQLIPDGADPAWALASTRSTFEHRAVVLADNAVDHIAGLDALAQRRFWPGVVEGVAGAGRAVFVFPGQGAQWVGMAVSLLDSSPTFAASIAARPTGHSHHTPTGP